MHVVFKCIVPPSHVGYFPSFLSSPSMPLSHLAHHRLQALLDYERHIGMDAAMLSIKNLSRPAAANGVSSTLCVVTRQEFRQHVHIVL